MHCTIYCPYYLPHTGGLETHSDEFNKYISQHGVTVTVFTPHLPKNTPTIGHPYPNVTVIRFPAFEIIPNYPIPKCWQPQYWQIVRKVWQQPTDIIVSRTRFFITSLLALIHAKTKHLPWVHIEHGSEFVVLSSPVSTLLARIYDHIFGQAIFHFSSINISISKAVQAFIARFDSRVSPVIYRGLEFSAIDAINPDATLGGTYPDKIIISTAARLYKWKGVETTIAAIKTLPPTILSQIVFIIIGSGEDFVHLKKLSRGLPVHFTGNIPRHQVIGLLKSSDIYIHSSKAGGGLSTSLLEAMYCKCAVIATKNEGANEVLTEQKNGLILHEETPSELAAAITQLVTNKPLQQTLSQNSQPAITGKFNWPQASEAYLHIFTQLCQNK